MGIAVKQEWVDDAEAMKKAKARMRDLRPKLTGLAGGGAKRQPVMLAQQPTGSADRPWSGAA